MHGCTGWLQGGATGGGPLEGEALHEGLQGSAAAAAGVVRRRQPPRQRRLLRVRRLQPRAHLLRADVQLRVSGFHYELSGHSRRELGA